jgi:hypothetical protein
MEMCFAVDRNNRPHVLTLSERSTCVAVFFVGEAS